VEIVAHLQTFTIGPFELTACQTVHDAAEPLMLGIVGPQGEKVAAAYDLGRPTNVLKYLLRSADCLIVESNHDEAMLQSGPYPRSVRYRIGGPAGHLSNRDASQLLVEAWHPSLGTIVLAHISESCNRKSLAEECATAVLRQRGYAGQLFVAEQDRALAPIEVSPL
jgi:phosphoribosyl 1,2-cyclic phosphodiesterase